MALWRVVLLAPAVLLAGCGYWGLSSPVGGPDNRTPLVKAAQAGDLSEVQRLLAAGADPNEKKDHVLPPLNAAILSSNVAVVEALLRAGADPNGRVQTGYCFVAPLTWAAQMDNETASLSRALLRAGANPEPSSECSRLQLGTVRPEVARVLVDAGFNFRRIESDGKSALHVAAMQPAVPYPGTVEYLIGLGVPVNARDNAGKTPLAYWREPRFFERQSLFDWLLARIFDEPEFRKEQRARRDQISAILSRAGATL